MQNFQYQCQLFFAYIGVSSYPKMDDLCPSCGMIHTQESQCAIEQGSPVFRRRRSIPSPCETPTTSTMRLSCDNSTSGPTPNKQKRLSGILNITDMQLKDEELDADNINSDIDETEEVDRVGASQYPDDEVFDPEGGGLLSLRGPPPCGLLSLRGDITQHDSGPPRVGGGRTDSR